MWTLCNYNGHSAHGKWISRLDLGHTNNFHYKWQYILCGKSSLNGFLAFECSVLCHVG
jgi:hypothetical protein